MPTPLLGPQQLLLLSYNEHKSYINKQIAQPAAVQICSKSEVFTLLLASFSLRICLNISGCDDCFVLEVTEDQKECAFVR
jgi:hypothetical protein